MAAESHHAIAPKFQNLKQTEARLKTLKPTGVGDPFRRPTAEHQAVW